MKLKKVSGWEETEGSEMKREISVSFARTISLGDHEFARIQAGITEEMTAKDNWDYQDAFNSLFEECDNFVLEKCEQELNAIERPRRRSRRL